MDLAQLKKSTPMEVLEHVRGHLLEQNAKSMATVDGTICAYRGIHCRKCGAGCLLSEGDYNRLNAQVVEQGMALNSTRVAASRTTIEGLSWHNLCALGLVSRTHKALIMRLQTLHDIQEVEDWPMALSIVENDVLAGNCDLEEV